MAGQLGREGDVEFTFRLGEVQVDPVYGCVLWTGWKNSRGYGYRGRGKAVHVEEWERANGPVPPGLELDHLCRRRTCANPLHLDAVSHSENERRKDFRYRQRRVTHCPRGHELTFALVTPEGGRVCRDCLAQECS